MRIAILIYGNYRNDARVEKAAAAYAAEGHQVRVVALEDNVRGSHESAQDGVLRATARRGFLLRRRPDPALRQHRTPLKALTSFRHLYTYLWSLDRLLALAPRWTLACSEALRLKVRHRRLDPRPSRGSFASLVRFADRIRGYRRFAREAARLLDLAKFQPELVHANDFSTLFAAELLHDRLGVPFIYDTHELWSGRNRGSTVPHPLEADWELQHERRIARKALAVITVSASIAQYLAKAFDIPEPVVVRNVPYAAERRGGNGLRRVLGLLPEHKVVLYTGKATFNRGLEEAIAALAGLPEWIHLVVLGNIDPRFKLVLDAAINQHAFHGRFHHYGPVPSHEVPAWAAEGDLCLVPIKGVCLSYEYCLPNKLFEGVQAGLPVLASNLVEMRRTLEEYGCGITYESGNVADLRSKISHILGSPEIADRMRRNAEAAAREFNWEREKARLLEVLSLVQGTRTLQPL